MKYNAACRPVYDFMTFSSSKARLHFAAQTRAACPEKYSGLLTGCLPSDQVCGTICVGENHTFILRRIDRLSYNLKHSIVLLTKVTCFGWIMCQVVFGYSFPELTT